MAVCTKFSVKDIQLLLRNSEWCDQRSDLIVPNVSWGLLPYEADLLSVRKSGLCAEFEIKRSFEDFKKDFTKDHFHDAEIVAYFYYVVPEKIVDKVKVFLREMFDQDHLPAVIQFNEDGNLIRVIDDDGSVFGKDLRPIYRKVTEAERVTLGRLASLRYWSVQEEVCSTGYSGKDRKIENLKTQLKFAHQSVNRMAKKNGVDKWVNCSSYLPCDERDVLVCHYDESKEVAYFDRKKRCWCDMNGNEIRRWVVGWTDINEIKMSDLLSL